MTRPAHPACRAASAGGAEDALARVEAEVDSVGTQVAAVEAQAQAAEAAGDAARAAQLRSKEEQLRTEKHRLRIKAEQLREAALLKLRGQGDAPACDACARSMLFC